MLQILDSILQGNGLNNTVEENQIGVSSNIFFSNINNKLSGVLVLVKACPYLNYFLLLNTYIGQMKEQVLPEPVWAIPRASRPLSTAGMAVAWMGVGWVNSLLRIRVISASSKPK